MRLINADTLKLEEFVNQDLTPPYAILSHTWEDDEVTFQDWRDEEARAKKRGFRKIELTCRQAIRDGYSHVWVDTNCIDKRSSAELSESINSMFAWYRNAAVCYVYMADVPTSSRAEDPRAPDSHFRRSRWFTRGWTLQELIAPLDVEFYTKDWVLLGTKENLVQAINEATGVDEACLRGDSLPTEFGIAETMSWASARITTRPEDQAYCLLGLFGVNMPLLYGEGSKAFLRLQEEIIKISDDQSIFAWGMQSLVITSPLATSPAVFSGSRGIRRWYRIAVFMENLPPFYSMTNAGLSITLPLIQTLSPRLVLGVLNCYTMGKEASLHVCIPLSSHATHYRHQYIRVALPAPWVSVCVNATRLPRTSIMISVPSTETYTYSSSQIFGPVRRMDAKVFFFITFPYSLSKYRLSAAYPPEALEKRTSLMAMISHTRSDNMGCGLLVFEENGSGYGSGKYVGIYLEAALRHEGAAEDWPRACRVIPNWDIGDSLDTINEANEDLPLGRSSWAVDVSVSVRTVVPIQSGHAPNISTLLLAEIVFGIDHN